MLGTPSEPALQSQSRPRGGCFQIPLHLVFSCVEFRVREKCNLARACEHNTSRRGGALAAHVRSFVTDRATSAETCLFATRQFNGFDFTVSANSTEMANRVETPAGNVPSDAATIQQSENPFLRHYYGSIVK